MKTKDGSKLRIISTVNFVLLVMLCTPLVPSVVAAETPTLAPVNPAFLEYLAKRQQGVVALQPNEMPRGYIPSPVQLPAPSGAVPALGAGPLTLPSSYDLRTLGKVTPIRDQDGCGDCWAYGAYASLESCLLTNETWDFSENNLNVLSGFDYGCCSIGDSAMCAAYLARWSGPVSESDDPETYSNCTTVAGVAARKHVQEVLFLPVRTSSTDNNTIKQAVMTYGAVDTAFVITGGAANRPPSSDTNYNASTYAYYFFSTLPPDHEVAIVGWDDDFAASNFTSPPPGNGAFIVRNSWGTAWGQSGYFYISYYDYWIGRVENAVFVSPDPTDKYSRIYQYDPLGWVGSYGYGGGQAWGANIFTAAGNEQLRAVSFYTPTVNAMYQIYVYTNTTSGPTSGTLASSTSGTNALPGYFTIALPTPVNLTAGLPFSVAVRFTAWGCTNPIPVQYALAGYSSSATAAPGQSYFSSDGNTWTDATTWDPTCNVCIKAFTSVNDVNVSLIAASKPVEVGGELTYAITVTNLGPAWATSVTVTNSLSAGWLLDEALQSQGNFDFQGDNIIWSIGTLKSNAIAIASITVTPTLPGFFTNTVTVTASEPDTNPDNNTAINITKVTPLPLAITTSSPLPTGMVGVAYSQTLTASGGIPPYSWSVVSDSLPAGLTLVASSGSITGAPTVATTACFTVRVTDAWGEIADEEFSLPITTAFQVWQVQYFGCTEINCPQAAPDADPLGKGMSNTNQFLAGFNPTNSAAYLHIINVDIVNATDIYVTYLGANGDSTWSPGVASRTNVLDYTTGDTSGNFMNGGWQDTGQTNILSGGTGTGILAKMVDAGGATNTPSRYYRVRVLLP
jgi:uncharacterized repeat protein (TIGR01451 family)